MGKVDGKNKKISVDKLIDIGQREGSLEQTIDIKIKPSGSVEKREVQSQRKERDYIDAYGFFFMDMPLFKIWNRGNEIFFSGEIYEDSMNEMIMIVDDILEKIMVHKAKYRIDLPLVIHINSIGGSVSEGFRAIDYISARTKELGVNWVNCAMGRVASMGFVFWVSGDTLIASRNTTFLIHQIRGVLHGKREDIKDYIKMFDDLHGLIVNHIARNTGLTKDEVEKLLKRETWLTANEIKNLIKREMEIM